MMNRRRGRRSIRRQRRAVILIVLIFVMTFAVTLFGLWARQVVRERHQVEMQQFQLQAVRLAEAGVQRLLAKHRSDKSAQNESWSIPAQDLDNRHAAVVRLQVLPAVDGKSTKYMATAEFPAESLRNAVVTRSLSIPNTISTDTP